MNTEQNIFVGRLGKKPDLRYTPKSEPVCYLSVAINKEGSDKVEWKRVIVWGKQAELCKMYLDKGKEVFVQGRIVNRPYKDNDGVERVVNEVKASLIGFPNT
jgi:single-strand DNA-binding protein